MKKIFLATRNKNKIKEISQILENCDVEILSINDSFDIPDVIEDADTFEGNSAKKAIEIAKILNMPTIADDSGLCVEALNEAPGVYSARYSGSNATDASNNEKLIRELQGVENRTAHFVCVITLAKPSGEVHSYRGELYGTIVDTPQGANGFGYDPHFFVEAYNKTLAELPEVKSQISHRAKALENLKLNIKNLI